MATKITISKALEHDMRNCDSIEDAHYVLQDLLALLDAAQTKRAETTGLAAQAFIQEVQRYRPILLPKHNGAAGLYKRLSKTLQTLGVTLEQAAQLGLWLKDQSWIRDEQLTIERLCLSMSEWLTRSQNKTAKQIFNKVKWEDA